MFYIFRIIKLAVLKLSWMVGGLFFLNHKATCSQAGASAWLSLAIFLSFLQHFPTWQRGTLFLPNWQTTVQDWPGKASEQ